METKNLFALVLLAAVAIQATSAASASASASASFSFNFQPTINKIRYAVGNLTKMASTTISSNVNKLGSLAKNISKIENAYLNNATKVANQLIYKFINATNVLTSSVGLPISNISKCINTTDCVNTMRSTFMGNVTKCIKSESNTTLKIINSHVYILKNFSSQISKLSNNVTKCISSMSMTCANNLLNNLTKMMQNIPKLAYNYTNQDLKRVALLPSEMAICHIQTSLIVEKTAAQLGMKHINCIAQILKNKTASVSGSGSIGVNGSVSANGSVSVSGSGSASAGNTNTTTSSTSTTTPTTTTTSTSTTTPTTTTTSTSTTTPTTTTTSTSTTTPTTTTASSTSTTTIQSG